MAILYLYNRGYQELVQYANNAERENAVHNSYLSISRDIADLTSRHPVFNRQVDSLQENKVLLKDTSSLINNIEKLKSLVEDSANARIADEIKTLSEQELNWLFHTTTASAISTNDLNVHLQNLYRLDTLIRSGTTRTAFLIGYRKDLLHREIKTLRIGMGLFIALSFMLILYTSINLSKQKRKRLIKEKELETALTGSMIP